MTEKSREQELARAAEELHGATADLREILEAVRRSVRPDATAEREEEIRMAEYRAGLREQPTPKLPLLPPGKDPTLARRFEEELHSGSVPNEDYGTA